MQKSKTNRTVVYTRMAEHLGKLMSQICKDVVSVFVVYIRIKRRVEFSAERLTHFLTVRPRCPPWIGMGISVGTFTGFDVRGIAVWFLRGRRFVFSKKTSTPALTPNQPYMQRITGTLSAVVKLSQCKADHSHQFCAEIKNKWSYASTSPHAFIAWTWTTITP
jgi:hypothetical protein